MKKRLLIMAAGTGGHIFPGIAIANTMRDKGWEVSWLGTRHGMERDLVPKHGILMDTINFSGLRGKGLAHTAKGAFQLLGGFSRCMSLIGERKPDVVLGMGGYVTVPGGVAAKLRGIPLALVNADAALLLSNKALTPLANSVLFGFPANYGPAAGKAVLTGNPVRQEILDLPHPEKRYPGRTGPLRILVVGGSLGAKALNETVPVALSLITPDRRPIVVHQTGRQHEDSVRRAYADFSVQAEVVPFIDNMPARYAEADLVVCRAGAITVSELTAAGVASILVPLVASTTSHQRDNAEWMAKQEAAIHVPQSELTPARLAALLDQATREKCVAMADAAYRNGRRNANDIIATVLEELAEKR